MRISITENLDLAARAADFFGIPYTRDHDAVVLQYTAADMRDVDLIMLSCDDHVNRAAYADKLVRMIDGLHVQDLLQKLDVYTVVRDPDKVLATSTSDADIWEYAKRSVIDWHVDSRGAVITIN